VICAWILVALWQIAFSVRVALEKKQFPEFFFTAWRYASGMYAVVLPVPASWRQNYVTPVPQSTQAVLSSEPLSYRIKHVIPSSYLTLVLQWYFLKRTLQFNWRRGGGKWPPRCISGSVPPRDKIRKAIPMFSRVSFSAVPIYIPLPQNSRWPPKTGSSLIFARVVVSQGYLSWLLCFPARQIECHFYLDHNHLDATF